MLGVTWSVAMSRCVFSRYPSEGERETVGVGVGYEWADKVGVAPLNCFLLPHFGVIHC